MKRSPNVKKIEAVPWAPPVGGGKPTKCGQQGAGLHLPGFLPYTDLLFLPCLSSGIANSNHESLWMENQHFCTLRIVPSGCKEEKGQRLGVTFSSDG